MVNKTLTQYSPIKPRVGLYRNIKFLKQDFFTWQTTEKFDGVISDPPYKNAIKEALNEQQFNVLGFLHKADQLTSKNGFLIVFTNFAMTYDLRHFAKNTNWHFHTYMIWDKAPTQSWIAWSLPLRSVEFVLFFNKKKSVSDKNYFKFNFRDGSVKAGVNRSSFGGGLKATSKNDRKTSQGTYPELLDKRRYDALKIPGLNHLTDYDSLPSVVPLHLHYNQGEKPHFTPKPKKFSYLFRQIVGNKKVLDPFCGTSNLLSSFSNATGIDIRNWATQPYDPAIDNKKTNVWEKIWTPLQKEYHRLAFVDGKSKNALRRKNETKVYWDWLVKNPEIKQKFSDKGNLAENLDGRKIYLKDHRK